MINNKIKEKFKLGSHYRMERFSTGFISLLVVFVLLTGVSFAKYTKNLNHKLSNQAIYTTNFTTSKTNVNGSVVDIYTSKDKTESFIIVKFDNVAKISTDADDYQMFLTGADVMRNKTTLESSPSGSIYMFGSSGYMGIYLVNQEGFDEQILDLTIRANAEIVPVVEGITTEETDDSSFAKYDQFRINFNPGGSDAKSLNILDADDKTTSGIDLYTNSIAFTQETEIREKLDEELDVMRTDLAAISEYERRLRNYGVQLPETPELIDGDEVISDDDGNLTLVTDNVVPKGYDFNWRDGNIVDGYLDELQGDMTNDEFFRMKNEEIDEFSSLNTSDIVWRMTDGSLLEDLNTGDDREEYTSINSDVQLLTSAWSTYYQHKVEYQRDTLKSLLIVEDTVDFLTTNLTINTSDDVLILY